MFGIDGLIARVVIRAGSAFDIGRQRQMAVLLQQLVNGLPALKTQAEQFVRTLNHDGTNIAFKNQLRAGFGRFGRTDVRQCGVIVQNALYQGLDFAAALFLSEQPRFHDFGVVEH